jgi:hypothetical protein
MLDKLPQLVISLVIFATIAYTGVAIMDKIASAGEGGIEAPAVVVAVPTPATTVPTVATVATVAAPETVATLPALSLIATIPAAGTVAPADHAPQSAATEEEIARTVSDAFGWMPILIVAIVGGMILSMIVAFADMGGGFGTTPARRPEPVRSPPPRGPTVEDLVARDPEVVARTEEISAGDAVIAALREEREQQNAERGLLDRVVRWARRRTARREGA